jgi:hypothetical protein
MDLPNSGVALAVLAVANEEEQDGDRIRRGLGGADRSAMLEKLRAGPTIPMRWATASAKR